MNDDEIRQPGFGHPIFLVVIAAATLLACVLWWTIDQVAAWLR